jgi:pantothenate synthetase
MCERRRDKLAWSSRSECITTSEASAFEASLFCRLNYLRSASTSANTITLKKAIDHFTEIWVRSIRRDVLRIITESSVVRTELYTKEILLTITLTLVKYYRISQLLCTHYAHISTNIIILFCNTIV